MVRLESLRKSLSFVIILRWLIVILSPVLCGISGQNIRGVDLTGNLLYLAVTAILSVCRYKNTQLNRGHWAAIHLADIAAISMMVFERGGIRAECFNLYYIVILQAALIFGVKQALSTLLFSNVFYAGVVLMGSPTESDIRHLVIRIVYSWLIGGTAAYLSFVEKKHRQQAVTDSVTSVYNRFFLEQSLRTEICRAAVKKTCLSVVMVDIDNFKAVNDSYGHMVGDQVLQRVARVIQANIREVDLLARYGGEEFIVTLPATGPDRAREVAERIRQAVEKFTFCRGEDPHPISITISCGVASYPLQASDADDLMKSADECLYEAKRGGRNQVYSKAG